MSRRGVLVVGAAALLVLCLVLLRRDGRGVRAPAEHAPIEAPGSQAAIELESASAVSEEATPPETRSEVVAVENEGSPSAAISKPEHPDGLQVRVVDASGRPVRLITVEIRARFASLVNPLRVQKTASDGRMTFKGLSVEIEEFTAALRGTFETPVERHFSWDDWPAEPIEFVLPPSGSVLVDVLDRDGNPLSDGEWWVDLERERKRIPGALLFFDRGDPGARVVEGQAHFEPIGLGLTLLARLKTRQARDGAEEAFQGPTRDGEEVRIQLQVPSPGVELLLRVLDVGGEPLSSTGLMIAFRREIGRALVSAGDYERTDEEGRLRLTLEERWSKGTMLTLEISRADGWLASGQVDLSRAFPPGVTDLGDVLLEPEPLLASGRVVDEEGVGVEAYVSVVSHPRALFNRGSRRGQVESDGHFAVYGDPPGDNLHLEVSTLSFQPVVPIPVVPGTRGMKVVLHRGGTLTGSVLVPEGFPPQAISLFVTKGRARRRAQVEASGHFRIGGLEPGAVDVQVCLLSDRSLLAEISAVSVGRGDKADQRLQDMDLRALVRRIRIGVSMPDGHPADAGWVRVQEAPGFSAMRPAFVVEGGEAVVLVPSVPLDLEVSVPGFRSVSLQRIESDREVRLENAFEVRCELPSDVKLPSSGSLRLELARRGDDGSTFEMTYFYRGAAPVGMHNTAIGGLAGFFDEKRLLTFSIPRPGTYEARFHLVFGDGQRSTSSFQVPSTEPQTFELDARSGGRTLVVRPDPVQYAARAPHD